MKTLKKISIVFVAFCTTPCFSQTDSQRLQPCPTGLLVEYVPAKKGQDGKSLSRNMQARVGKVEAIGNKIGNMVPATGIVKKMENTEAVQATVQNMMVKAGGEIEQVQKIEQMQNTRWQKVGNDDKFGHILRDQAKIACGHGFLVRKNRAKKVFTDEMQQTGSLSGERNPEPIKIGCVNNGRFTKLYTLERLGPEQWGIVNAYEYNYSENAVTVSPIGINIESIKTTCLWRNNKSATPQIRRRGTL